jgi:hypothetical protein
MVNSPVIKQHHGLKKTEHHHVQICQTGIGIQLQLYSEKAENGNKNKVRKLLVAFGTWERQKLMGQPNLNHN